MVRIQARKKLIDFSIATNPKYKPNWHHDEIAKELEKAENGTAEWKILILCMPPRHGKSEETTVNFPAWYLGKNPDREIITASYSADLALDFGSKTRDLINSEAYRDIFPGTTLKEDERGKAKWKTNKKGSYTSVGMGGSITGRGAHILVIDDPIKSSKEADSATIRKSHWDWFTSTAWTRLAPNGRVIIIVTRWHLADIVGMIMLNPEFASMTKMIKFPAIAIEDEPHRKAGEALWPSRYSLESLEQTRQAVGPYVWSSLYQQHPIITANQEFRDGWRRTRLAVELDLHDQRRFLTVDTAVSKRDSADWCGFCDNSVDEYNNWNFRAWRMRLNPKELIDLLFILYEKRGYELIGIEETVYLLAIEPFLRDEMVKRDRYLPIVPLKHKEMQKETRIRGLIPRYAAGKIFHVDGECADLEAEEDTFPKGLSDDVLDAAAYQIQIAEEGGLNKNNTHLPSSKTKETIYDGI